MTNRARWLGAGGACALALAVVACGSTAATPSVAERGSPSPSPSLSSSSLSSSSPGPSPVPASILNAVTNGSSERIDVVAAPGSVLAHPPASQAAALRTARRQEPPGSRVLGMSLARVKGFGFGSDLTRSQLAWVVSMDPWGGSYGSGGRSCGRINYDVELIDPVTGTWLMASAGRQPGLPPLPQLGPTPSLVQPTLSCGVPVAPVHQGTPAAF